MSAGGDDDSEDDAHRLSHHTVNVLLPSYDELRVDFYRSKQHEVTIGDIKYKIQSAAGSGVDPRRMRIYIPRLGLHEIDDAIPLIDLDLTDDDVLTVVYKMIRINPSNTMFQYEGFIRSIEPEDGDIEVPITVAVTVVLGPNDFNHILHMPSLIDSLNSLQPMYSGNMIKEFDGDYREARKYGYREWTDATLSERVLLLEVDERLDLRLEHCRYNTAGVNDGYYKGDFQSWQRYTLSMPIECKYSYEPVVEFDHTVRLTVHPFVPLKYSTNYALVFCNNVPTIPAEKHEHNWMGFTMGGANEDKVYIFRTENESWDVGKKQ